MKKLMAILMVGLFAVTNACFAEDWGLFKSLKAATDKKELISVRHARSIPDFDLKNYEFPTSDDVFGKRGFASRMSSFETRTSTREFKRIVWYYDTKDQTAVYVFDTYENKATTLLDDYVEPTAKFEATKERE